MILQHACGIDAPSTIQYFGAIQRLRSAYPHDPHLLETSGYLIEYPFAERLYPSALDTVRRLNNLAWRLALLPPWYDVDTLDDWRMLCGHITAMRRAGKPGRAGPLTFAAPLVTCRRSSGALRPSH